MGTLTKEAFSGIVMVSLADLTIHPLATKMPMLAPDAPERVAARHSIELHGLGRQPLIINERLEIMDGRHRRDDAKRVGLLEVPCIIRPDEEAAAIIVESLLARRHYTKGARAYLAAPLLVAAAEANKAARRNLLMAGDNPRKPLQAVFGKTESEFSQELGFSVDEAQRAKTLHVKFAGADARVAKWRAEHPDVEIADEDIEENLRARFEPLILSGEMGLGGVLQAIAGIESTRGQSKSERSKASLFFEGMKTFQLRFGYWETFSPEEKRQATRAFAEFTVQLPADVQREILATLARK